MEKGARLNDTYLQLFSFYNQQSEENQKGQIGNWVKEIDFSLEEWLYKFTIIQGFKTAKKVVPNF